RRRGVFEETGHHLPKRLRPRTDPSQGVRRRRVAHDLLSRSTDAAPRQSPWGVCRARRVSTPPPGDPRALALVAGIGRRPDIRLPQEILRPKAKITRVTARQFLRTPPTWRKFQ